MLLTALDIEIIEEIKRIVLADLQVHYSIGCLSEKAGMSESRLKICFRQVVKTSLYAYLKDKRMLLAANLLEDANKTIMQISKAAGFKYYSNFTRAFKKHFKETPAIYRKQKIKKAGEKHKVKMQNP